jgi:hypothetical protein
MESHASLKTASAARYLTQLCKHWGHRFPVAFDATQGRIDLPSGPCLLWAEPDELRITLRAAEPDTMARLEDVVESHLARFAFREGEIRLAWTRAWPAGSIDLDRRRVPGARV